MQTIILWRIAVRSVQDGTLGQTYESAPTHVGYVVPTRDNHPVNRSLTPLQRRGIPLFQHPRVTVLINKK